MLVTQNLSIGRWHRVEARLSQHITELGATMARQVVPVDVNIDRSDLVLPRIESSRNVLFNALNELDLAMLLRKEINLLIASMESQHGLTAINVQIESLEQLHGTLQGLLGHGARSRVDAQQELMYAIEQFNALRNAGESNTIKGERQRLKELSFSIPVVGPEDLVDVSRYAQNIKLLLDDLQARDLEQRSFVQFSLRIQDDFAPLLSLLGLGFTQEQEPVAESDSGSAAQPVPEVDSAAGEQVVPHEPTTTVAPDADPATEQVLPSVQSHTGQAPLAPVAPSAPQTDHEPGGFEPATSLNEESVAQEQAFKAWERPKRKGRG